MTRSTRLPSSCRLRPAHALALALLVGAALSTGAEAQPIGVENWVTVRSESFVLRSNADAERTAEIAGLLEAFRAAFAQLAPGLELESPVPMRILAFRDGRVFDRFKLGRAGGGDRILGQFLTHPDGNFITLDADPRLLGGFGVVLHEYVHHLVAHNLPGVPRWFNEGLAEYYSTFSVEGGQAVVGRPPQRHLEWLRRNGEIDLASILEAGSPGNDHSAIEAGRFYAVSWGLVHYLLSSNELSINKLADFLSAAALDRAPADLFETIFDLRLAELETRLRHYLLSESLPAAGHRLSTHATVGLPSVASADPAEVLCDLAGLAVRLGNNEQAASLFELAIGYDPDNADAYAGLAHVRNLDLRVDEAEGLFAQALELGPRDARSVQFYGRHLLGRLEIARRNGDREAVVRLANAAAAAFRAALGLDPDFAEARAMLGYTHLFGDLDPEDGVAPLARASELLPARPDIVFHLLQLELRRGEVDRARQLAGGPLRRRGGREWTERAEEEIERSVFLRRADSALKDGRHQEGLELIAEAIAITSDPDLRDLMRADLERLKARLRRR